MNLLMKSGGRLPLNALALALGIWVFSGPAAVADGDGFAGTGQVPKGGKRGLGRHGHRATSYGTLGYGGPGLYPGFQGFGLGYHPGYGYGGDALGVGADGGYPFYGGPGYPHPWPRLRRIGGITPFPYYGGPGFPSPGHPNYFGGVGPLAADRPVVTIGSDRGDLDYASGYGPFTGTLPYPDTFFAPFAGAGRGRRVIQRGEFALSLHDPHEHRAGHGRDHRFARSRPLPSSWQHGEVGGPHDPRHPRRDIPRSDPVKCRGRV